MDKHRDLKHRRAWWQLRTELKHRVWAARRDFVYDWREFWTDFAEWKENRNGK